MFGIDDALLGALVIGGTMAASSAYSAHSSKQQGYAMNKESWEYYKKQKDLDYSYDSKQYLDLDKAYNEWYKQLDYDWSKRYAENSSKWQVEGLKAAGLNPLLAASNGNFASTYGTSTPVTAKRSSSGSAIGNSADMHGNLDMAGSAAHIADAFRKTTLLDAEAKSARASANVADSTQDATINSAKADASLKEQRLNTERILQNKYAQETAESAARTSYQTLETEKLARSGGYSSNVMKDVNTFGSYLMDTATKGINSIGDALKNSAKQDAASSSLNDNIPAKQPQTLKKSVRDYESHINRNNGVLFLR